MRIKKKPINTLVAIWAAAILVLQLSACDTKPSGAVKSVDTGSTWEITEITNLSTLTIAEGAAINAPEGYSLTMTVDGVETGIAPGTYEGEVVLTPTEDIIVEYGGMGTTDTYYYRTAIYVDDGAVVPEKSVMAAVVGGEVTDDSATDVSITSIGNEFNGIISTGDSTYSIRNPKINFTGYGGNDFAGFGAAIMSDGNANVTLENASIITTGAVRTAVWVGGNSTMHVNDSYIETNSGPLPEDYGGGPFGGGGGVMMEVPWMLGISGNCRSTNCLGEGTVYYNNTHIKAQAWGALSTDACQNVKLYASNCLIETVESGYGAYADGTSIDTFSGCEFNVTDYGLILTQGSAVFTDGTVVNSGRFGVMSHSSRGDNTLTINKGSVFNTKEAVIQLKSSNPTVIVDNAQLNSESGVILQAMVNDDPNAGAGGAMPGGAPSGGPGGGMPGSVPGGDMPGGGMPGGAPGGGMPGGGMPGSAGGSQNIAATFKNMTLNGDIITSMTSLGDVNITLENTTITGAITTATATPVKGVMPTQETYYLIGDVKNVYCATDDKYGMKVSLDGNSIWSVDETSYLTSLKIAEGAVINAPEGYSVTMTIDGAKKTIGAGSYEGNIVLTVTKIS